VPRTHDLARLHALAHRASAGSVVGGAKMRRIDGTDVAQRFITGARTEPCGFAFDH
jgi:hypothetical protein